MYNDTPYDETCPCCDSDMAWKYVDDGREMRVEVKCFHCGHTATIGEGGKDIDPDDPEFDEDENEDGED